MEPGALYADARRRITDVVQAVPDDDMARPTPACPQWTVLDVLAHVTAIPEDILEGRIDGAGTDPWTARQVDERRGRHAADLLEAWQRSAPPVEAMLGDLGDTAHRLIVDIATHEQDIRGALGHPGGTDGPAFDFAVQVLVGGLDARLRAAGAPALQVTSAPQEWTLGDGPPAATARPSALELFRALTGRRSDAQVRAWAWEGDSAPYLPHISTFGALSATDVVESGASGLS